MSLVQNIVDYERATGRHRSGSFSGAAFQALADLLPTNAEQTVETGCGKSTILFSNLSQNHLVFTLDDRHRENSSVNFAMSCPLFVAEHTNFVLGPTQQILPTYHFESLFDAALLDGTHAFPGPELEYYFIHPHLRDGALLILDDIHIPTVGHLFNVLREDAMFEPVLVTTTLGILRRTDAPLFDPFTGWWRQQNYNARRFRRPTNPRRVIKNALNKAGLLAPARMIARQLRGS